MSLTRRGVSLVEMIVALVLGGVVMSALARAMSTHRRVESRIAGAHRSASAAEEVVRVSTAMLARVARDDHVWVRGDTAIEWRATIGVALACVAGGDSVVLPAAGPAAWWEFAPDSGDAIEVALAPDTWTAYEVTGVSTRAGGGACGGAQRTLRVSAQLSGGGPVPVRVLRRTRLALYRGGDGAWWLGERRCPSQGATRCAAAQPVAGPLDRPPLGLTFAIDSARGRLISVSASSDGVARVGAVAVNR